MDASEEGIPMPDGPAAPSASNQHSSPPVLSVVIPVYNVEGYLALCLESVLSETRVPIEVVCVDDGSTDRSGELLERAAALDDRVRVIHTPNRGLSPARNAGIDAARGRYLCFLDADDRMLPHACETIVATFEATDADVVTYGAQVYPAFWAPYWVERALSPRDVVYEGFESDLVFVERSHPFVWRTACRRELLTESGLRFDETLAFGEDQAFLFELYPRSRRTVLMSERLVSYRVSREGSLMDQRSTHPMARIAKHIEVVGRILDDWSRQGYLQGREQAMFDWIIEFVGIDILSLESADRTTLVDRLRQVIAAHFSPDFTKAQSSHPVHGFMAEALLAGNVDAYTGTPQELRLRYYGARDGWWATLMRSARIVHGNVREHARALEDALARLRGGQSRYERDERAWMIADAEVRAQATARLTGNSA